MFSYSMDPSAGILHLTVAGRATFEDFQEAMPGMLEALQSGSYPNFLLEIKNLDESESVNSGATVDQWSGGAVPAAPD